MKYVIIQMDPRLWKWSHLEYVHISNVVGKENLIFTNIKGVKTIEKLGKISKIYQEDIASLNLKRACILDPAAEKTLSPADKKNFDYLIFGGVLGDDPPRERTKLELTNRLNLPSRNIGKVQMPTDTAVEVTKIIIDGTPFEKIKFMDGVEIELREGESMMLPYRHLLKDEKGQVTPGLVEFLQKRGF